MKKAALITCHNIKNYGSVFQTYATTKIFEKSGYDVTVIDYQRPGTNNKGFRKKILEESHLAKKPIIGLFFPLILSPSFSKMEKVFSDFLKKKVKLTRTTYLSEAELEQDCPEADLYISGSDQIWNSDINGRIERPYYLSFVPDNKSKISFASSFGKTELKESEKEENRLLLKRYNWLSTREQSGVEIIMNLGLEANSILDPTFWLSTKEWDEIEEQVKTPEHYILVYQLHQNREMDHYVKTLENRYGMPCLRIDFYYHYMIKAGKHIVCPTPGQVISLIKKADYVISDSFHMTAFSIIYNKLFVSIFSANSFNDRIANILRFFGLESRILESYDDYDRLKMNIDYDGINSKLNEKKKDMQELLSEKLTMLESEN